MEIQNFIVLGIIPGTNVQIDFQLWLTVTLGLVTVWQLRRLLHSTLLAAILLRITFTTKAVRINKIQEITI
ncbi:hypothetical protein H7097_02200 [Aeromicrobium sp.]|nr:hypothetical protein [Candidatus Saccharibacteria bacterium]